MKKTFWHIKYPELLKEVDSAHHSNPVLLTTGDKIWWKCNKGHQWQTTIPIRTKKGHTGCPYCSGRKVSKENNLRTCKPDLAQEWSPKNVLNPENFSIKSYKKVWWECNKGHEWQASIKARTILGHGCPYCSGRMCSQENSIAITHPFLLQHWDCSKNTNLTPYFISAGSDKQVWWKCDVGHTYQRKCCQEISALRCPKCFLKTSQQEIRTFSELLFFFNDAVWQDTIEKMEVDVHIPSKNIVIETDGYFWHKDKLKKDIKKTEKLTNLGKKVIRLRELPLKKITNNDITFSCKDDFVITIQSLLKTIIGKEVLYDKFLNNDVFNRLVSSVNKPKISIFARYPLLEKEWNYDKNGCLNPSFVSYGSNKKVWWKCSKGHEWAMTVKNRRIQNCPFCSNRQINKNNCLSKTHPDIAKEWDYDKNGCLNPENVVFGSHKKVWWKCNKGHKWIAAIEKRTRQKRNCPYCSGQKATFYNCLSKTHPDIAKEWDYDKNSFTPNDISKGSSRKVWWICQCGRKWESTTNSRKHHFCANCWRKMNAQNSHIRRKF